MTTQDIENAYREVVRNGGGTSADSLFEADAAVQLSVTKSGEPGAYVQIGMWVDAADAAGVLASQWINSLPELPSHGIAKAWYDLDDKCIHVGFSDSGEPLREIEWPEPPLGLKPQDLLDVFCDVWNAKHAGDDPFSRKEHYISDARVISSSDLVSMHFERD